MRKLFVYLFCGALCLAVSDAVGRRPPCVPCPESEYPVCATNGTHWFLFRNECRLNAENDKRNDNGSPSLQKTEIANCFQRCDQVCTKEYAPICARYGDSLTTFQNRCQLDLENCKAGNIWKILHEGECSPIQPPFPPTQPPPPSTTTTTPAPLPPTLPPDDECPTYCTLEYMPICATLDGVDQTFPNLCYLKADVCTSQRNWQIKYEGECVAEEPQCDDNCPKIYSPMCATFNGENRTFINECFLDLEICQTQNLWDILYKGECRPPVQSCRTICPQIYRPVCASNNGELRTFPNKCILEAEACKNNQVWVIEYDGECIEKPQCPEVCPYIYDPVCATFNGIKKTFSNKCLLDIEICKSGQNWQIISNSVCSPQKPPPRPKPPVIPPNNCPDACPAVYNPVCAVYRGKKRTFSNSCELGVVICKTGQDWQYLFGGPCEKDTTHDVKDTGVSICPANYDPVCAASGGETKTFSNKCQMDAENARTRKGWQIVALGECEKPTTGIPTGACPKCSDYYQPVCGFYQGEQKTFINECQMLGENCYSNKKWVLVYEGECQESDRPRNCPNICPLTYDPVCATHNGVRRTFPNECELNHESYKSDTPWIIVSRGECDYCPPCSDESDPVCAQYNGQTKTFDNTCKMEAENCKTGSEWKIVSKGLCEDDNCPKFCPRIYRPVCASSGSETRTFSSVCEMKREACSTHTEWTVVSEGECPDVNVECPTTCRMNYNPVCAMYQGVSRNFLNECMLRAEICKTKQNWLFLHPGRCAVDEPQPDPIPEPQPDPVPAPQPDPPQPSPPDSMTSTQISNVQLLYVLLNRLQASSSTSGGSNPNPYGEIEPEQPQPVVDPSIMDPAVVDPTVVDPSVVDPALIDPPPAKPRVCERLCMDIVDYVCAAYNGAKQWFVNECTMQNYNCRFGENWQVVPFDQCQFTSL